MAKKRLTARKKTTARHKRKAGKNTSARKKKTAPRTKRSKLSKKAPRSRPSRSVTVTLSDEHLPSIERVASKLRAKGMKVDSILEKTGQITGTYSKHPSLLKKVTGVLDAEEQPVFQLPPPDSDIQ